jgi:HEAT repeat protein
MESGVPRRGTRLPKRSIPDDTATIRGFARDPDASVRSSAAFALRKIDTAEAHDALGYEHLGKEDLAAHQADGAPVRAMLEFLMTRNGADNTMMAEIRHMLRS